MGDKIMKRIILCCLLTLGMMASASAQQQPTTIAVFDGGSPSSLIVRDGVVYGITNAGGANGFGMLFQLAQNAMNGVPNSLHDFTAAASPSLVMDSSGVTIYGAGDGGLFSLTQSNSIWTYKFLETLPPELTPIDLVAVPSVPAAFYFLTHALPTAKIVEVMPPYPSSPNIIHTFDNQAPADCLNQPDGRSPFLLLNASNATYGVTARGGTFGLGTIFSLIGNCETVIYNFNPNDSVGVLSGTPGGSLVSDSSGALYGIANTFVTNAPNFGLIYKLTPPTTSGGQWIAIVIKAFNSDNSMVDGFFPTSLVIDSTDTLYGMTLGGGANFGGTIFTLSANGIYTVLYNFPGQLNHPRAAVVDKGTLYGTTDAGELNIPPATIFTFPIGCQFPAFTGTLMGTQVGSATPLVNGWVMDFDASTPEGLLISNVKLNTVFKDKGGVSRFMAKNLSMPQYNLTNLFGSTACTLAPNGPAGQCQSTLVNLTTTDVADAFVLEATYAVNNLPDDPTGNASLCLKQTYKFVAEKDPTDPAVGPAASCEPSGTLTCAKFFPSVSYSFSDPNYKATITTSQRLELSASSDATADDPFGRNESGIFHDCNFNDPSLACGNILVKLGCTASLTEVGIIICPPPLGDLPLETVTAFIHNPLVTEVIGMAINAGQAGDWDNFHQTYNSKVSEPTLQSLKKFVEALKKRNMNKLIAPGCPECVHIHWRWSDIVQGAQWGNGLPLTPPTSAQSVQIAVVQSGGSNDNANSLKLWVPTTSQQLASTNSVTAPVFWYGASSGTQSDIFFKNGGWYSTTAPRQ
jgi:uncharacterized repeat protein (TIGR03803 family)